MVKQNVLLFQVCQEIVSTEHILLNYIWISNKRIEFGIVKSIELKNLGNFGIKVEIERIMMFF